MNYIKVQTYYNGGDVIKNENDVPPYVQLNVSRITEHIYLGGMIYDPMLLERFIDQENIQAILTIWNDAKPIVPSIGELDHHYININDTLNANIAQHFPSTFGFLQQKIEVENKRVYVHCHAGVSRSAVVVIHYLAKHTGKDLPEVAAFVSEHRPDIYPNSSFIQQLVDQFK